MSPECTLLADSVLRTRFPRRGHLWPIKPTSLSPGPVFIVYVICHRTCELVSDPGVSEDRKWTATVTLNIYCFHTFFSILFCVTVTCVLPPVAVSGAHHGVLDLLPVAGRLELLLAGRVGHDGEVDFLHHGGEGPPRKQRPPASHPACLTLSNNGGEADSDGFLDSDTLIGFLHWFRKTNRPDVLAPFHAFIESQQGKVVIVADRIKSELSL